MLTASAGSASIMVNRRLFGGHTIRALAKATGNSKAYPVSEPTSPIPIAPRAVNRPDDGTAFILGGRKVSWLRVKNPPAFSAVLFSR